MDGSRKRVARWSSVRSDRTQAVRPWGPEERTTVVPNVYCGLADVYRMDGARQVCADGQAETIRDYIPI